MSQDFVADYRTIKQEFALQKQELATITISPEVSTRTINQEVATITTRQEVDADEAVLEIARKKAEPRITTSQEVDADEAWI